MNDDVRRSINGIIIIIIVALIGSTLYFGISPRGRETWNNWFYNVQKADDDTNYKTKKKAEDTCRAMIASYNSDKLVYDQYRDSTNKDEVSWAQQAKMRANKTASSYNNYILENSFIWQDNIPQEINKELPYIN